jgi:hypothetical protein
MKIPCTNPGCDKHTHALAVKLRMPGSGKKIDDRWFCSHRCYGIYLADRLIREKRRGLGGDGGVAHRVKLGMLLLKNNLIRKEQLSAALEKGTRSSKKLGEILVDSGQVTEKELKAVLSQQAGVAPITLDPHLKVKLTDEIPFKLINEFHFVVFDHDEDSKVILIALYDADYISCLGEYFANVFPGYLIKFYIEDRQKILDIIFRNYPKEHVNVDIVDRSYALTQGGDIGDIGEIETTAYRIMDFLNRFCVREAKIDNLENSLWIRGETTDLKIDVYLTGKKRPGQA